jgi:hypothetical protein
LRWRHPERCAFGAQAQAACDPPVEEKAYREWVTRSNEINAESVRLSRDVVLADYIYARGDAAEIKRLYAVLVAHRDSADKGCWDNIIKLEKAINELRAHHSKIRTLETLATECVANTSSQLARVEA